MANQQLTHIWTKDGLRLSGVHYLPSKSSDVCVLITHGMSGNILENYFAHILGETLSKTGIGCLYGHNRGYNHINDIMTRKKDEGGHWKYETHRIGATYELLEDCVFDIDGWVEAVRKLGYSKIVLLGHSLGCNKTIYYYSKYSPKDVIGIVLASPPDMVGLFEMKRYNPHHKKLYNQALENIKNGNPIKLVSEMLWDWYSLSSQTYVSHSTPKFALDNLPVLRNPKVFPQLLKISVPILGIMGEKDDIEIRNLKDDLNLISQKATNCPKFSKAFIKGANHTYDGCEKEFSDVIVKWIKRL